MARSARAPEVRRRPSPHASDLATIASELDALDVRAREIAEPLDAEALVWRPPGGGWSIAEILEHLATTVAVLLPALDAAVSGAEHRGLLAPPPYRLGTWGRLLVAYVEPPPLVRLPAPRPLRPPAVDAPERALASFLSSQATIRSRMERMGGLDLARARWIFPLARYIRMNLITLLCVHAAHARRHLWQAEKRRREIRAAGELH